MTIANFAMRLMIDKLKWNKSTAETDDRYDDEFVWFNEKSIEWLH